MVKKDVYYFSHDYNAHDDPKIIKLIGSLGLEGYGIYWLLVELLRAQPEFSFPLELIPDMAERYRTSKEKMAAVVSSFNLFQKNEVIFWSPSLNRRMAEREEIRQIAILAAQKSVKVRLAKRLLNAGSTDVQRTLNAGSTDVQQGKERKGKEIKGNKRKLKERKLPGEQAADFSDNTFLEYFEKIKPSYQDLNYELEFVKFKDYWNGGAEKLTLPNRAWSNWLDKAREYKSQRGNGGSPAKNNFGNTADIIELLNQRDKEIHNG